MRGTLNDWHVAAECRGIIPAYAGNTLWRTLFSALSPDHPRVCGEHEGKVGEALRRLGSSPRMRGALHLGIAQHAWLGIIPAYAGSTHQVRLVRLHRRDHPRVCGEHWKASSSIAPEVGSSPRMRGALDAQELAVLALGIIPAYAGSTRAHVGDVT